MLNSHRSNVWCAQKLRDRRYLCKATLSVFVTLLATILLLQALYLRDSDVWDNFPHNAPRAERISATHLLSQPLAGNTHEQSLMPKYIHQSWMTDELPTKLSRWSRTCQLHHPEWQFVLWTDEDNLRMVERYFPWFLETYRALPAEINRADVARNMYMYLFGGVYADLDTECLKPLDQLFRTHGVLMNDGHTRDQIDSVTSHSTAFFGRMGFDNTDVTLFHTIPNAWMAATPGIPFFLLVLEQLMGEVARYTKTGKTTAEDLTGPVALYKALEEYEHVQDSGISSQDLLAANQSFNLFERSPVLPRIVILPPENIYPYPWNNAGKLYRSACWSAGYWFNSRRCKKMVVSDETYTITYWSHTWNKDLDKTHDEHSFAMIGRSAR